MKEDELKNIRSKTEKEANEKGIKKIRNDK